MVEKKRDVLPTNLTPTHYSVDITPDFTHFKFKGTVVITLKVNQATSTITCNANDLTIHSATLVQTIQKTESTQTPTKIEMVPKKEQAVFHFANPIPANTTAKLTCTFTGIHNDKMCGFYRSGYTDSTGVKKWMCVTQFEACDCRRAFPCWDEPALKATFDITLRVPKSMVALSNMDVLEEVTKGDLKVVKFNTSPIVSTYLVAFCVAELDYVETTAKPKSPSGAKPIKVRVYTNKGESDQGRFALEVAARTLEFFSEYFDCAYPLPKMDMIAVPDFGAGAMENCGLVTYRTIYILFDQATSSSKTKQGVAYVVGHELAHQWFGNLVTMEWWSDLWLNEGFATFVGWLAVDYLYPEWNVWTQFVVDDYTNGMHLDALRSSHPIEVDVQNPEEINQIFDSISYCKGASLIRMLNYSLGQETFTKGVRTYLKEFAYKNATTKDLWRHLSKASGVDVEGLMKPWAREMGYPKVTVLKESYDATKKEMTLTLKQSRFLSAGGWTDAEESDPNATLWWIPLGITTNTTPTPFDLILTKKQSTITFPYTQSDTSYWLLNTGRRGFFRTQLQPSMMKRLSTVKLGAADRIALVNDAFSLAKAGNLSTVDALEVLKGMKGEEDYIVLSEMATNLNTLISIMYKQPQKVVDGLNKLKSEIFSEKKIDGWVYGENEDHLSALKRTLVIGNAAKAGDSRVVKELQTRFNKFINGDEKALPPNLRHHAFSIVLRTSTSNAADFEKVLKIYKDGKSADLKLQALQSLGATNAMENVDRLLNEIVLDKEVVRPQDAMYVLGGLNTDSPIPMLVRPRLWEWCRKNWDELYDRYNSQIALLAHALQRSIEGNVGIEFVGEVEKWSKGLELGEKEREKRVQQLSGIASKVAQSLEKMKGVSGWVERDAGKIGEWVGKNY